MATLSWGKPKIEICAYVDGALPQTPTWTEITLSLKQGSTSLETEQGDKMEALDEGGNVVDVRYAASKYTLTFSLYMSKGATKPISDTDGIITTNYAVRLTPEDSAAMGFMMPKCSVSVQETFSSEEGGLWVYTFSGVKPATGTILQRYTGSGNSQVGG